MKTSKWRFAITALVIMMIGLSGFVNGATSANLKYRDESNDNGLKKKETSAVTVEKKAVAPVLWRERADINKDLTAINQQQAKVKSLEKQCRDEHKAGIKSAATHSELLKAKADLKRDKAYLRADKAELEMAHRNLINEREKALSREQAEIREAQRKLDSDLAEGKASAVEQARIIVDKKQNLKQKEFALEAARNNRDSDLALVNKEIMDTRGESALVLTVERPKNETAMK